MPVVVPFIPLAIAAAGAGLGAYGAISSAQAGSDQADAVNQQMEAQREVDLEERDIQDEERQRRLNRVLATQRAIQGASGVGSASGSPLALQEASVGEAARERYADQRRFELEDVGRQGRMGFNDYYSDQLETQRNFQIGSSILNSASRYYQLT